MGLPQWRDPTVARKDETHAKSRKDDPTATARSSIRRRPEVHGRGNGRARISQWNIPRLERTSSLHNSRRGLNRLNDGPPGGLPPVRNLFERVDRMASEGRLPPPVPVSPTAEVHPGGAVRGSGRAPEEQVETNTRGGNSDRPQELVRQLERVVASRSAPFTSAEIRRILAAAQPASQSAARPQSRDGLVTSGPLFTPAADESPVSPVEADSLEGWFVGEERAARPSSHPLRYSWRPSSPTLNGLGDRTRSPTPGDGWEIMRTTITPDETLPSADSSFTSAAASRSFGSSNASQVDGASSQSSVGDATPPTISISELPCNDEDMTPEAIGRAMYLYAIETAESQSRLGDSAREHIHLTNDIESSARIGLRVFHSLSAEAREYFSSPDSGAPENVRRALDRTTVRPSRDRNESVYIPPTEAERRARRRRLHGPSNDELALTSQPARLDTSTSAHATAPQASSDNDLTSSSPIIDDSSSHDEVQDDLVSLRAIVDRLAARDAVPDDFWLTIGLDLRRNSNTNTTSSSGNGSITRPQARSRSRTGIRNMRADLAASLARVQSGRVERSTPTSAGANATSGAGSAQGPNGGSRL